MKTLYILASSLTCDSLRSESLGQKNLEHIGATSCTSHCPFHSPFHHSSPFSSQMIPYVRWTA